MSIQPQEIPGNTGLSRSTRHSQERYIVAQHVRRNPLVEDTRRLSGRPSHGKLKALNDIGSRH
jgi:hypothetical protein